MAKRVQPLQLSESNFSTAPGFFEKVIDTGSNTGNTSSSSYVVANGASGTLVAPITGKYYFLASLNFYHTYGSNNRTQARFQLSLDSGAQLIGGSDQSFELDVVPSNTRERRMMVFGPAEITAGSHTIDVRWKRSYADAGTPTINYDAAEHWTVFAVNVSGSSLGGEVLDEHVFDQDTTAVTSGTWTAVQDGGGDITVTATVNANEQVKFEGPLVAAITTAEANFDKGIGINGADPTESLTVGWARSGTSRVGTIEPPKRTGSLTAGTYTFRLMAKRVSGTGGLVFYGTSGGRQSVLRVTQYRGGQLEWRDSDGNVTTTTPRYVQTEGAITQELQSDGGVKFKMPDAITAPGDASVFAGSIGTNIVIDTTATNEQISPESGSYSYIAQSTKTKVSLDLTASVTWSVDENFIFTVEFDDGVNPVIIAGDSTTWRYRITTEVSSAYVPLSYRDVVELIPGTTYEVRAYGKREGANGSMTIVAGLNPQIIVEPVTGSGAGGEIVSKATIGPTTITTTDPSWQDLDSVVINLAEDDEVELNVDGFARTNVSATPALCQVRVWDNTAGVQIGQVSLSTSHPASGIDDYVPVLFNRSYTAPADGQRTFKLQANQGPSGTTEWVLNAAEFSVRLARGGLVPEYDSDGNLIGDKPAARQYGENVSITNVGGKHNIDFKPIAEGVDNTQAGISSGQVIDTTFSAFGDGEEVTGSSVTVTLQEDEIILARISLVGSATGGDTTAFCNLTRDGTAVGALLQETVDSGDNIALTDVIPHKPGAAGSYTFAIEASKGGNDWTVSGGFLSIIRFKGGYVQSENVPILDGSSVSGDTFDMIAAPGASNEARLLLNDGIRYKATLPLSVDLGTSGLGGLTASASLGEKPFYIYAVPSTVTGEFDLVVDDQSPKSGGAQDYSIWRYVGPLLRTPSALRTLYQVGNRFWFAARRSVIAASGGAFAWTAYDLALQATGVDGPYVPETAGEVEIQALLSLTGDATPDERWDFEFGHNGTGALRTLIAQVTTNGFSLWNITDFTLPIVGDDGRIYARLVHFTGDQANVAWRDFAVVGFSDAWLSAPQAQTQAKYTPDTKLPWGTWQSGGTQVVFDFAPSEIQSTFRWTAQDGKQRTMSLPATWDSANGVGVLGYDSGTTAGTQWLYFYLIGLTNTTCTIIASDNPPSTGPDGYSNYQVIWKDYQDTSVLRELYQYTQNEFRYPGVYAPSGFPLSSSGAVSMTTLSLATIIPIGATAYTARMNIATTSAGAQERWAFQLGINGTNVSAPCRVNVEGVSGAVGEQDKDVTVPVSASQQCYYAVVLLASGKSTIDEINFEIRGWIDGDLS